jgi:hypothetical protein
VFVFFFWGVFVTNLLTEYTHLSNRGHFLTIRLNQRKLYGLSITYYCTNKEDISIYRGNNELSGEQANSRKTAVCDERERGKWVHNSVYIS